MDNEDLSNLYNKELIKYVTSVLDHRYNEGHAWHIDYTMIAIVAEFVNRLENKKDDSS